MKVAEFYNNSVRESKAFCSNLFNIHDPSKIFGIQVEVVCASLCIVNSLIQIYCLNPFPALAATFLEIFCFLTALFGANAVVSGDWRHIVVYGFCLTSLEAAVIASIVYISQGLGAGDCIYRQQICNTFYSCDYHIHLCNLPNSLKIGIIVCGSISFVTVPLHLLALRCLKAHISDEKIEIDINGQTIGRGNVIFCQTPEQEEFVFPQLVEEEQTNVNDNPLMNNTEMVTEQSFTLPETSSQPPGVIQMQPIEHYPYEKEASNNPYGQLDLPSSSRD